MTDGRDTTGTAPDKSEDSRLAVMQPYFLPYVGYFQLIDAVDVFILYDDVQFMKQGWVNRNSILLNGTPHRITIPVRRDQLGGPIREVLVSMKPDAWIRKMKRTVEAAYRKAPCFEQGFAMFEGWLPDEEVSIGHLNHTLIRDLCEHIGITTTIKLSSDGVDNRHLERHERLINFCKGESATTYLNAPGGRELYQQDMFEPHGIQLKFLAPLLNAYTQSGSTEFHAGLSMLDLIMNHPPAEIRELISGYSLED